MNYIVDNFYEFEVDHSVSNQDYFYLIAHSPNGKVSIPLKKFFFQKKAPYNHPATIICRVKSIDSNGLPEIAPSIASYVKLLYNNTYLKGDTFECKIVEVPENPHTAPYVIEDKNGIFFKVSEPEANFVKGQKVNFKFTKLTDKYFSIQHVDEETNVRFYSPEELLELINTNSHIRRLTLHILHYSDSMEEARKELLAARSPWILTALKSVIRHLPEWFLRKNLNKCDKVYMQLISTVKDIVLLLLEGSNFLSAATAEQRRIIQELLTDIADSLDPYEITLGLIRYNQEDVYVRNLLDKLRVSGYLYHPARQFAVLMLIFRRHPDKVEYYLSRIFESIFGRDLENWNREPFKSAFIEQFQIYVRQTRTTIDSFPVAESREQKAGIENIILAIAMQLLLNPEETNMQRQWSLFYRYISLLRPLQAEGILTKSYISLLGAELPMHFTYGDLKQPMMLITQATVLPGENLLGQLSGTHRFRNKNVDISISSEGLIFRPSARFDITEKAIPAGLMTWLKPQIMVNGVRGLNGTRLRKISEHNAWWHEIEVNLFEQGIKISTEKTKTEKIKPTVGSQVYIVIDSYSNISTKNPVFNCRISDTEYEEGRGILKRENIVAYGVRQIFMSDFYSANGRPRGFLATITKIDENGNYEFSLLDEVNHYATENLNYDDEYRAIITISNERTYAAISDVGVGLLLERNPDFSLYNGSIVKFKFNNIATEGQRIGYITGIDEDEPFDQSNSFSYLIGMLAEEDNSDESDNDEEVLQDFDELLSAEDLLEIIEIIRFKAIAETDLIKAYDYLRLARIIALSIDQNDIAETLLAHSTLLSLHQFYATNSRIDSEKLEELRDCAQSDPLLKMIFHRLELVSWLGKNDKSSELYNTIHNPSNVLESDIARMVMAYNLLQDAGDDSPISGEIKQKIMEKLNVNNETRKGKYYGTESKYLEFKTSIIYRPGLPGEEIKEDPQAQQFHILSRVAGLLNANGGRLYLGVSNDGFEVGLHDDFKYFERHSLFAKNYEFKHINTLDKLTVFLEELVNQNFERKASRKISISIDEEAEKGVIVFNVEQSLEPVFLDGRLFVRQSGQATREYRGKDIDDFVNERSALLAERRRILDIENNNNESSDSHKAEEPVEQNTASTTTVINNTDENLLLTTSNWRPNILHSYENGYVEPYGYFYFKDDNTLMFSTEDKYIEPGNDGCTLALAISQNLYEGFLIFGYDNERVLKVPVAEIVALANNHYIKFNSDYALKFVALANNSDGLVCVAADNSNTMSKRYIPVSDLPISRLSNQPKRLHEAVMNHTVYYEIVDSSSSSNFDDCRADKMQSRRFGMTLRCPDNAASAPMKLKEISNNAAPLI